MLLSNNADIWYPTMQLFSKFKEVIPSCGQGTLSLRSNLSVKVWFQLLNIWLDLL